MRRHSGLISIGLGLIVVGMVVAIAPVHTVNGQVLGRDSTMTSATRASKAHTLPGLPIVGKPMKSAHVLSLGKQAPRTTTTTTPTWTQQPVNTTPPGLRGVDCAPDGSFCYTTGVSGTILITNSVTASSWGSQTSGTTNELTGISCPATTICYAVGGSNADGGSTGTIVVTNTTTAHTSSWATQTSSIANTFLTAISCPSTTTCYAVGTDNILFPAQATILTTTNGGVTWTPTVTTTIPALYSISCLSVTTCYAVGTNGGFSPTTASILFTANGGATWTVQQTFSAPAAITGVTCITGTTTCYAIGTNSFIGGTTCVTGTTCDASYALGTTNAGPGGTWSILQTLNVPPGETQPAVLQGLTCTSVTTCYAVGTDSYLSPTTSFIVTTNNAWSGFAVQTFSPTPAILFAVTCRDAYTCYTVGGAFNGPAKVGVILGGTLPPPVTTSAPISVQSGWNLFALPVSPTVPLQSPTVLASVVSSSHGSLAELATWQGAGWATDLDSGGTLQGSPFALAMGSGYFLYSDQPATITVSGITPTVAPLLALSAGWNLIGLPTVTPGETATTLLSSMQGVGLNPVEAAQWTGTAWVTRVQTQPGSYQGQDFALSPNQGYFVYVQTSGSWRNP